jgi:hypothetical protein
MKQAEKAYLEAVADLGCIICRSPASIHHIRAGQGMAQRASNYLIIPLCGDHHQHGGPGVAIHAGQRQWEALYGSEMDLLAKTIGEVHKRATGG